jgi:hypothetical protein
LSRISSGRVIALLVEASDIRFLSSIELTPAQLENLAQSPKVIAALEKRKFLLSRVQVIISMEKKVVNGPQPGPQGLYTALMASCRLGKFVST